MFEGLETFGYSDYAGTCADLGFVSWSKLVPYRDGVEKMVVIPHTSWGDYNGSTVERSNHRVLLERFKEWPGIYDCTGDYSSHAIVVNTDEACWTEDQGSVFTDILRGLQDYPIVDEDDLSELESEIESEEWDDIRKGMNDTLKKHYGTELDFDEDSLYEVYRDHGEWQAETAVSGYVDMGRMVKTYLETL